MENQTNVGLKLFGARPETLLNGSDGVLMDDTASSKSHWRSQSCLQWQWLGMQKSPAVTTHKSPA